MRLTNEQVAKYQAIYLETFGVPISEEDTLVQGLALLRLVKNISIQLQNKENEYENVTKYSTTQD